MNKLGDPNKKMASQVVYFLRQLVDEHKNMRPVVVRGAAAHAKARD